MALATVLLAVFLATGSARSTPRAGLVVVDADRTIGQLRPSIWDEVNLWKLYGWFGVHFNDPTEWWGADWLRRKLPWVRYARVVAPLGGSYSPGIAAACDHAVETTAHRRTTDCGEDGSPGPAARNEVVKWVDDEWVVDYEPFRTGLERLQRSGVKPHINLSGMPVMFSGGDGDFRHYHWNAKPPEDLDGWLSFISGALRSVEHLDRTDWRVSIINEPNCLIPDEKGVIQHVGFAGDPDLYARTWAAAARTIHTVAPEVRIHPGNYVVSDSFPGENNLHLYLDAMKRELANDETLRWQDLPYIGVSLYEVLDTTIERFRDTRIKRLYDAQSMNDLPPRPIKIDELGIHENVREPYDATSPQDIDTTLFAASWYAEAIRSFIDAGDVVSAAPWLDAFYRMPRWRRLPAAYTYWMLGLLAGQLSAVPADDDVIEVRESGNEDGRPRVPVMISLPREPRDRFSTIRALATSDEKGSTNLMIVHHQPELAADGDPRQSKAAVPMRIAVTGLEPGAYRVRHTAVGGRFGARWDGEQATPLRWLQNSCVETDGRLLAPGTFQMPANSVWLFEFEPTGGC